jgi:hypothetical protein
MHGLRGQRRVLVPDLGLAHPAGRWHGTWDDADQVMAGVRAFLEHVQAW